LHFIENDEKDNMLIPNLLLLFITDLHIFMGHT
jgi:hypothetical protein